VLGGDPEQRALLTAPPGSMAREQPLLVPRAADADDSDEAASGSESDSDSGAFCALGFAHACACVCALRAHSTLDADLPRAIVPLLTPDEDDTAALLAELERIKGERAEEAARKDAARAAADDADRAAELASGNPLLALGGGGGGASGGAVDFSRAHACLHRLHFCASARVALRSLAALTPLIPPLVPMFVCADQ
jgi:hypothetical protein